MKIIGVIPARRGSSRFFNKPTAKILGKPMIWWVYKHSKEVKEFDTLWDWGVVSPSLVFE